jgi:cytochrome c oxidase subunit 2
MRKIIEVLEPAEYQKWMAEQKSFVQQNPAIAQGQKVEVKEIAGIEKSERNK